MKPITKVKIKQDGDTWKVEIRNNLKLRVWIEGILQAYHAAQLEAGIKAKAIRKKGNPEKWIRYDASINKLIIEAAPCPIYQFEEIPILPADAELVDITIIVKP